MVLESGGVDKLEFSLFGFWSPSVWNGLKPRLDEARKRAESGLDETAYVTTSEGDQLTIEPTGCRHGVYCRWIANWNGCRIAIVNNPAPSESRLSVHVTIDSIRLMEVGHVEAWRSLMAVLQSLGYQPVSVVPGRVDLCVDLVDISMALIKAAVDSGRTVCRARKDDIHRNRATLEWETYKIGRGPILLRVYNKALECQNDPVKQLLLIERRWGKFTTKAIRVEFQLRTKALQRHFSIKSVEDLFANLGTIAKWCTEEWFRLTEKPVDRKNKNQQRAGVSELWKRVQESFNNWTGTPLPRVAQTRKIEPNFQQLKEQAVGCVSSIAAHFDNRSFIESWVQIGRELKNKADAAIEEKRMKLAAAARVVVVPDSDIPF